MTEIEYGKSGSMIYLPVDKILPNPYQTRTAMDMGNLEELAASIRKYGVLQPIGVRLINHGIYELIFGERRLRACRMAGICSIPAVVSEITDRDAAALTIAENIHRKDLNYIEMAEATDVLGRGFGYNTDEMADIINIEKDEAERYNRLNGFCREIKTMLIRHKISEEQAELILKAEDSEVQKELIERVSEYGMNTEKTAIMVNSALRERGIGKTEEKHRNIKKKFYDLRLFTNTLKQAVDIINEAGMESSYNVERDEDRYRISIDINV